MTESGNGATGFEVPGGAHGGSHLEGGGEAVVPGIHLSGIHLSAVCSNGLRVKTGGSIALI